MSDILEREITPGRKRSLFNLYELWRFRDLVLMLAHRDISIRYRRLVLGIVWALLQPLGMTIVLNQILGRTAAMQSENLPYPVFILSGWLAWNFFSTAMTAAGGSVIGSPNLITKVYFPRLVIPAAAFGVPLMDLLVGSTLMATVLVWYGISPNWELLLVPPLLLVVAMAALGAGCFIAAANVAYRDFRHVVPFLTTLWFWLTPVVYPLSAIPQKYHGLMLLNPLTGLAHALRLAWVGAPLYWPWIAQSTAIAAVLMWAGVAFFRSVERRFADLV